MTPDSSRIVTGSWDNTARIWDARSGAEIAVLKIAVLGGHRATVRSLAVTPDGSRIVTGSGDKTARIWDSGFLSTQALVDHAKTVVPRCLTPAQRERAFLAPEPPRWCITMKKWPYHEATSTKIAE